MVICLSAGCGHRDAAKADAPASPALHKIVVQLDWVPEPEHGGFFQAQARGWFTEAGLDVELVPGGAGATSPMTMVATGRAQFGQNDSTNVLLAIAQGVPLINVAAVFQRDPTVFMMHESNPISRWEEMDGKTVMARPGYAFLPYVKRKLGIDFKVIPQDFSLQHFAVDPDFIQQGYYIAEPWHLRQQGIKTKWLHVWDTGYDAYAVVIANPEWLRANREIARAFIGAYARGLRDYCEGDPTPAHEAIKRANPNVTDAFLAWSRDQIIKEHLMRGDPSQGEGYGVLRPERFATEIGQLEDVGALEKGKLKVEQVVTTEYLPPPAK